ncbi:MAG: RNA methyltransferase [Chloroflexi bacterium CFX1]|nr:RNA methyltransferase [Chloroflexi bacterium CFX1]MCQ3951854.1 RNA methyltransferase [Chloroflexota bacterium]MDL1917782.1 RNA methyltransferase [Chloroflexi bacterium CFX5]NUQ58743.1 RNA methyltransferase [Anaerolineales bacterium]
MDVLTSASNPFVKHIRSLRQKKVRAEAGTFLVEGIHHIGEAVEAGWEIESIAYAPETLRSTFAKDLLTRISQHGARSQPVSAAIMESLADKDNPQGILAVVRQKSYSLGDLKAMKRGAALVSPQDPGNLGTILRALDAVKGDALFLLDGGVELFHPTVVRASMGAIFWTPTVQASFADFVKWARKWNVQLIGSSSKADADYRSLVPQESWVLVLGSEQKGLSPEQTAACDATVSLPMRGRASSLNLAVAAGILLYQYSADHDA